MDRRPPGRGPDGVGRHGGAAARANRSDDAAARRGAGRAARRLRNRRHLRSAGPCVRRAQGRPRAAASRRRHGAPEPAHPARRKPRGGQGHGRRQRPRLAGLRGALRLPRGRQPGGAGAETRHAARARTAAGRHRGRHDRRAARAAWGGVSACLRGLGGLRHRRSGDHRPRGLAPRGGDAAARLVRRARGRRDRGLLGPVPARQRRRRRGRPHGRPSRLAPPRAGCRAQAARADLGGGERLPRDNHLDAERQRRDADAECPARLRVPRRRDDDGGAASAAVIRRAETRAELEAYTTCWGAVWPDAVSVEFVLERIALEPERLYLNAFDGDRVVGTGVVARSSRPGYRPVAVAVLRERRRRGLGGELLERCLDHARSLGAAHALSFVREDDNGSVAFARRHGFEVLDRVVSLALDVEPGVEAPPPPGGIEIAELDESRCEEAFEVYAHGVTDMPTAVPLDPGSFADWLAEIDGDPLTLVALAGGRVVGFAALEVRNGPAGILGNGMTTVLRSHRGRGIAEALKRTQIAWAGANRE